MAQHSRAAAPPSGSCRTVLQLQLITAGVSHLMEANTQRRAASAAGEQALPAAVWYSYTPARSRCCHSLCVQVLHCASQCDDYGVHITDMSHVPMSEALCGRTFRCRGTRRSLHLAFC